MAQLRNYPIGYQTFSVLRERDLLYIDKTQYIVEFLRREYKYVFLSRPRRFGKSLFVSTLKDFFEGRKDLFKGLAIENYEKEWKKHPVLYFDFSTDKHLTPDDLKLEIEKKLYKYEKLYGREDCDIKINQRLEGLIQRAYEKTGEKVVILFDEYDAPLLDVAVDDEQLKELRKIMQSFYSPLKANDSYLRFVFFTGITKFSQLSIFSELNNLENISMVDAFSGICGITNEEFMTQMSEDIEMLAMEFNLSKEKTIENLKVTYDSYKFSKKSENIFNPFSLLSCFKNRELKYYWFESGTPTYLINFMLKYKTQPIDIGEEIKVTAAVFDSPIGKFKSAIPLMYQSGYLTIKGYNEFSKNYVLGIPNTEVRVGLMESLLPNYILSVDTTTIIGELVGCLYEGEIEKGLQLLSDFLETVPYTNNTDYEGHWQQVLYVVFSLFGGHGDVEIHTKDGRIDLVMYIWEKLYLMELKINKSAQVATNQIDLKNYRQRFQLLKVPIIKIGLNFETSTKKLTYKIL